MIQKYLTIFVVAFVLAACQPQTIETSIDFVATTEVVQSPTQAPTRTSTDAISTATPTLISSPTATHTPTPPTPTLSPTVVTSEASGEYLVIDHTSIELFDKIPDEYIEAASKLSMLFRHASVGWNISIGLDCLMDVQPRRPYCNRGVPADERVADVKYDWTNWTFEYHQPPPEQNPGWYNKVSLFIERINSMSADETFDYVGFKLGYVDAIEGSDIDEVFFTPSNSTYPTITDLENLEAQRPDINFIYWTIALARSIGTADSDSYNQQLRDYAHTHQKILMDIADIESHTPDGTPCYDSAGVGHEALCDEYTDESNGGHLNGYGSLRMAQAMWVMMARLAGWDGK